MRGSIFARLLREIADAVDSLDDSEIDAFIAGLTRKAAIDKENSKKRTLPKNRHEKTDPVELENILKQLSGFSSREQGSDLLDRLELSRKELEGLARLRNIHVTKNDNVPKIKEKLIEVIIGSRLSSRAIRGE